MKLNKFLGAVLSSILVLIGGISLSSVDVHASGFISSVNDETVIELTQDEINDLKNEQMKNKEKNTYYEYDWRPVETAQTSKVSIGYPSGQPVNGTVFNSTGGFYWQDGSDYRPVTVNVGYGSFGVSVALGKASSSGTYIQSPWIKTPVKLHISKDIRVQKYKVYKRPKGSSAPWTYSHIDYTKTPVRNYLKVVKV